MVLSGLAFTLAGGCPGRQLFLSGEGDSDAAIFVIGMIVGATFAHNFGLASSGNGATPAGMTALVIGFIGCLLIGFTMRKTAQYRRDLDISNIVDTRGLSCPQPVIITLNEIKKVNQGDIVIMVDTDTVKENVSRAAKGQGWEVADIQPEDDGYQVTVRKKD